MTRTVFQSERARALMGPSVDVASSPRAKQPVIAFMSWESIQDLMILKELIEANKITPRVDRTYPLEKVG